MTVEHACHCLRDEHKRLVDESGCVDDAKEIDSSLNIRQDDVARSSKPSMPIYIFAFRVRHTYKLHNLGHILLSSATTSHHP